MSSSLRQKAEEWFKNNIKGPIPLYPNISALDSAKEGAIQALMLVMEQGIGKTDPVADTSVLFRISRSGHTSLHDFDSMCIERKIDWQNVTQVVVDHVLFSVEFAPTVEKIPSWSKEPPQTIGYYFWRKNFYSSPVALSVGLTLSGSDLYAFKHPDFGTFPVNQIGGEWSKIQLPK